VVIAVIDKCYSPGLVGGMAIQMLGIGNTESEARIAAYQNTHHGFNDFDREYEGGEMVEVSERLAALHEAKGWDDTYSEDGEIVGSECNDDHFKMLGALERLVMRGGKLDYRDSL
jgi:hypothetical protein